ncbi:MAG: pitrilysin [Idiomarina sp.]|nr:pitrilysin [Idiomarina sp.]
MRRTLIASLVAASSVAMLSGCQPAQQDTQTAEQQQPQAQQDAERRSSGDINISPNDSREYGVVRLDNGLNVIVVSDPDADKAAAALNVHVGSMQNPDQQLGLAHYLEHMLFLGTEKYPDPDEYGEFMARHGGMHNAYTADDHTNYMFQVNNDRLGEALDRFSDFFKAPIFDPEYSEKEVNAVDSEWSMRRASDGFILFKLNNVTLNPEHPIARFRIGNNESLGDKEDSVLYEEMLDFYQRYYSANLMTATIVGNYSVEALEEKARTYFADVANHDAQAPSYDIPVVTDAERNLQIFYKPQMEMRILQIDFTIENNIADFASKPNDLVAYMVNSEMPGTPGAYLREQEWADSLGAYAQPNAYGNGGRFIIQAELTETGLENREVIAGMIFDYLDQLREEGISEAYFEELGTVLNNRFQFLQRGNAFNYATQLAASMQHYPIENVIDYAFRLDTYDTDAIERVLTQLRPDNARVWFISPDEDVDQTLHFFDGEYRVAALNPEIIAGWREQAADIEVNLPSVNTLLPEDLSVKSVGDASSPRQVVSEGGANAWLQRSERFQEPRASVTIQLYQDQSERSLKEHMAAQVAVEAFNLSEQALAREASIAGVNFSLSYGQGLSLGLSGFNDKQPLLAERVLRGFAEYEPGASRLEQVKDRLRRNIENQARQFPVQQLSPRFNSMMQVPGANPEARLAALAEVSLSDVVAMRDGLLNGVHLRALVVGNYDADGVTTLVDSVREVVEIDPAVRYSRSEVIEPRQSQRIVMNSDVELEDVAVLDAYLFAEDDVQTRARASLMAELTHSRFFNELRTEKQLGYAVGVSNISVADYPGIAYLIQSSVANPQELMGHFDSFRADFVEHLESMEAEAFEEAKQGLLVSLGEQPQNLNQEAARTRADWSRENFSFDTRDRIIAEVERLTLSDMQAFYQRILDDEQRMRVLVQLRGTKFSGADWVELEDAIVVDDIESFQNEWRGD